VLAKTGGDIEKAVNSIFTSSTILVVKKSGNTRYNSMITIKSDDKYAAILVNYETDFVAQESIFNNHVQQLRYWYTG
jgi:translation elongation factor EF-Ts